VISDLSVAKDVFVRLSVDQRTRTIRWK